MANTIGHDERRPCKILTLDGGGLQALATLSILSDLCDAIAEHKNTDTKPAPHQLFDVIAGVGTGGWLALLLGRYRLEIVKCMSVYMEIAKALDPKTSMDRAMSKYKTHTRLDQKKLIAKIDEILDRHGLDPHLLDKTQPDTESEDSMSRCKYAFAVGVVQSPKLEGLSYQIFRTYQPKDYTSEYRRSGPDPATFKISDACAATGAAKYLLQPFTMKSNGTTTTFFDSDFPAPHNITDLALDEVYYMCGRKPNLSVIVNIGPGIPTDNDIREYVRLSRKFSWPDKSSLTGYWRKPVYRIQSSKKKIGTGWNRTDTSSSSGSEKDRKYQEMIRNRLADDYGDPSIYCRLGPPISRDQLSLNDVTAVHLSNEEIDRFLGDENTKDSIQKAAGQYLKLAVAVPAA